MIPRAPRVEIPWRDDESRAWIIPTPQVRGARARRLRERGPGRFPRRLEGLPSARRRVFGPGRGRLQIHSGKTPGPVEGAARQTTRLPRARRAAGFKSGAGRALLQVRGDHRRRGCREAPTEALRESQGRLPEARRARRPSGALGFRDGLQDACRRCKLVNSVATRCSQANAGFATAYRRRRERVVGTSAGARAAL